MTEISGERRGYCSVFNVLYLSVIKKQSKLVDHQFYQLYKHFKRFLIKYVRWHTSDSHIQSLEVRHDKIHLSQLTKNAEVVCEKRKKINVIL